MNKIPSFEKDHNTLQPGLHFSTLQRGVATFDLRFKKPNAGDFIPPAALHSIEHMLATALRNGKAKDDVIYFGPMGCRTGFYLLTVRHSFFEVYEMLISAFEEALRMDTVPGAAKSECGNYLEHDLCGAKQECQKYLDLLRSIKTEDLAAEAQKMHAEDCR